jgi:small subunit ribosomal protein S20
LARPKTPIKRHRQSLKRRDRNRARRAETRTVVRNVRELVSSDAKDEAEGAVREAASVLDRAARRRAIHPNKAARQKSRLMRAVSGKSGPAAAPTRKRAGAKRSTRARSTG